VDDLHRPGRQLLAGATTISAKALFEVELVEPGPFLGQRRPLRAVQRDPEHAEPEQRALEPDRRQRDADLLQQVFLRSSAISAAVRGPETISISIEVAAWLIAQPRPENLTSSIVSPSSPNWT